MNLKLIILLLFAIGLGLFSYSLTLAYYLDAKAADLLLNTSVDTLSKADYYSKEAALKTHKVALMDLGSGLAIAAATCLIFLLVTGVKTIADLKKLRSLKKTVLIVSANLTWLILIPGTIWYYSYRGGRGDYPPFADSIGIPIYTEISSFLFLLIPLNIFLAVTTIKSNLPTRIFVKPGTYTMPAILWEIFFDFFLLINLVLFVDFVVDGDHVSIPINLFFTYVLLCLRAGQLSK